MRIAHDSRTTDQGQVEPAHVIEVYCDACGYDLDQAELSADTCSDCGQALNLKQHVAIQVTTMPAASGGTLR
jgi:hypothetical protein